MKLLATIDARFRAAAPPERLAALRILVGFYCIWYFGARLPFVMALCSHDPRGWSPVGLCALSSHAPPPGVMVALLVASWLMTLSFTVGLAHRVLAPVFLLSLAWVTSFASSWGMIFHSENLVLLHVAILALTPAADVWSYDAAEARRRGRAPRTAADAAYGWPPRLMLFIVALTYLLAGVAKIRITGWAWAGDEVLRQHVAVDNIRKAELGALYSPLGAAALSVSWLWAPLAWMTLVVELGAVAFVLVGGKLARAWTLAAFAFHWGILALMALPFHYQLSGTAFFCAWHCEVPMGRVVRWWSRRRTRRLPAAPG